MDNSSLHAVLQKHHSRAKQNLARHEKASAYLRQKAHPEIEEKIKREVEKLTTKILKDLGTSK